MDWDAIVRSGEHALRLRMSAATDRGNVRAINEDSYLAVPPVFLVADGMGGHAHGDRASAEVVSVFASRHSGQAATRLTDVLASIQAANIAVRALTAPTAVDLAVAGSTLTGVALIEGDREGTMSWMAFNLGDSRVYSWRSGLLDQLTVDHSAVQELIDIGEITRTEADEHPERNVVTRAIGVDDDAEADVWLLPVGGSTCFLLCSDGLTKELSDEQIAGILRGRETVTTPVARRLVEAAVASGGKDNVTAVVLDAEWTFESGVAAAGPTFPLAQYLEVTAPRVKESR